MEGDTKVNVTRREALRTHIKVIRLGTTEWDVIGPYGKGNGAVEYWSCRYEVH